MPGTPFDIQVSARLPERLARLRDLAENLRYSWDRSTRALFARINPTLWRIVNHSPKAFLKRVHQKRLDEAAEDPAFLAAYDRVIAGFDSYMQQQPAGQRAELTPEPLVAYFCAEFGFHESLPIYSGGLGILAADHCKAASDAHLPFIGVGLLYDQGYFQQTVTEYGLQHATYSNAIVDDLPISLVYKPDGSELRIAVTLPGREVSLRVWQAAIGRVRLYLLDSAVAENTPQDRAITHRLYGGDRSTRIEQEILLGIGGVRALSALGYEPTAWHANEGHAAFLVLERIRSTMKKGLDFASALEAVAANTVFTTHTAVPAGHDRFSYDMVRHYFEAWAAEAGIPLDTVLALGAGVEGNEFDMTSLALRGSRYHNGVSAVHGDVSAKICAQHWPQIDYRENPIDHVTNGVHVPTFLAPEWYEHFDRYLGYGWIDRLTDGQLWQRVHEIPDAQFWAVRQALKSQLFHLVRNRVSERHLRNNGAESHLARMLELVDPARPNVLTIGFARRFATYKRAALIFENLEWLAEILTDPARPVLLLFAGKAHPADGPGQELIRRVIEVSRMPQFEKHIIFLEGYDLRLARRLVSGVDIWLNNPIYPLEASGTSGMKAAMNGVVNLSVLDGWWAEGFNGSNGWAIKPVPSGNDERLRDREEAQSLYEILQDQVLPCYYQTGPMGFSESWVALAKRSIATLLPRYNTKRMLDEYIGKFYQPATLQATRLYAKDFAAARQLASWKDKVRQHWSGVHLQRLGNPPSAIQYGDRVRLELAAWLNGLEASDVRVELLINRSGETRQAKRQRLEFTAERKLENGQQVFVLDLQPERCGELQYRIRMYPYHPLLTHHFEMGMMLWL